MAGQAGDMCFACGQSISGLRGAFGCALASRAELGPGPFGKRLMATAGQISWPSAGSLNAPLAAVMLRSWPVHE